MYRHLLWKFSVQPLAHRFFSTESIRNDELEKEKSLRERVLKKYPHLKLPPITSFDYGSFSTQTNMEVGSKPRNSGRRTFFLICVAGLMIAWTSNIIQSNYSVNNLSIPLWTGSRTEVAKHFLFAVQFETRKQRALLSKFNSLRRANPLLDFFSWLETQDPDFGCGRKYSKEFALFTILNALEAQDISRYVLVAMSSTSKDPRERIDSFIDSINVLPSTAFARFPAYVSKGPSSSFGSADHFLSPAEVSTASGPENHEPLHH